jgi:sigma-B regulation protein RsbQ
MPDNVGDVPDTTEPYGYPDMRTTQRNAVTLTGNQLGQLNATGHCPNLSAPEETVDAIKAWL